jgi:hypothetical protein
MTAGSFTIASGDMRHPQNSAIDQHRARRQHPHSAIGRYGEKEKLMIVEGEKRPQEEFAG